MFEQADEEGFPEPPGAEEKEIGRPQVFELGEEMRLVDVKVTFTPDLAEAGNAIRDLHAGTPHATRRHPITGAPRRAPPFSRAAAIEALDSKRLKAEGFAMPSLAEGLSRFV